MMRLLRATIVTCILASVGFILLRAGRAATFVASNEIEQSTLRPPATNVGGLPEASNKSAVLFGSVDTKDLAAAPGLSEGGVLRLMSTPALNATLDAYQRMGVTWVRTGISWARVQARGPTDWDWSSYDQVISALRAHNMNVLITVSYSPEWAKPNGCVNTYYCATKDPAAYGTFIKAAVSRYSPVGVRYWELWNEPNAGRFTPQSYVQLMKFAYPSIKQADNTATVLAGGSVDGITVDGKYSSVDFLSAIYANGGKPYFDALTHHPYCWGHGTDFNCPLEFGNGSAWSHMSETNPSLRSVMAANGDANKKIWVTEMGGPTKGQPSHISESAQAQQVTDSYSWLRQQEWAGPLFWYQYQDKAATADDLNTENWYGLIRADGTHKPAYDAYVKAVKR